MARRWENEMDIYAGIEARAERARAIAKPFVVVHRGARYVLEPGRSEDGTAFAWVVNGRDGFSVRFAVNTKAAAREALVFWLEH